MEEAAAGLPPAMVVVGPAVVVFVLAGALERGEGRVRPLLEPETPVTPVPAVVRRGGGGGGLRTLLPVVVLLVADVFALPLPGGGFKALLTLAGGDSPKLLKKSSEEELAMVLILL